MNEYTLEIVVRERLAELRSAADRARLYRAARSWSGDRRIAPPDTLKRLRSLLRLRSGVGSPSTTQA